MNDIRDRLTRWLARAGLLRGRWRRGRFTLESPAWLHGGHAHRTWRFGLYHPAGLGDREDAPLIVLLHGCRQKALNFAEASGWVAYADRERVRLLCPSQRRLSNLFRCWNWFDPRAQRGHGELDVVVGMLDAAARIVPVHAKSTAVVGVSAGGALAALMAFHHADRVGAAVAVAAPPLLGDFGLHDPRLVMRHGLASDPALALGRAQQACAPMLIIQGLDDPVISPRCAPQLLSQAAESWRRAGRPCERSERQAANGSDRVTEYAAAGRPVLRLIEVAGLGHAWTGGPGGHAYCEPGGLAMTAACGRFLRELGFAR